MKVYTVIIKVVSTDEDELDDVINKIRTCNSDNVNCEIGTVKEEE